MIFYVIDMPWCREVQHHLEQVLFRSHSVAPNMAKALRLLPETSAKGGTHAPIGCSTAFRERLYFLRQLRRQVYEDALTELISSIVKTLNRCAEIVALALVVTQVAALGMATAQTPATQTPVPTAEQSAPVQQTPPEDEGDADEADLIRPALETSLEEWRWIRRPVVVFADSPNDPRYIEQMETITKRPEPLVERDVIVITDTDSAARSSFRQSLRPRGFMVVVMGKDGTIIRRKPVPLSVGEISRSINKLPLYQREVRENRTTED